MPVHPILKSFAAGLAGTAAHLVLMFLKDRLGLLPQFQPYEEFQRGLSMLLGSHVSPATAMALSFVNGALLWGFIFGRAFPYLPGRGPLAKGLFFAACAWTISGLVFFPLMGRGLFASGLGLGAQPAALMAVMLSAYCLAMSFAWSALASRDKTALDAAPPAPPKSSDHSGRQ